MTYVGERYSRSKCDDIYDAIVIGSGMGGMSVASILSQKGKRVLLLEQHNVIGGCTHAFKRKGYQWNVGLHYVGDAHKGGFTRRMFDYITQSGVNWTPVDDLYNRVVIDGKEYQFFKGTEQYISGLKAAFPDETKAIDGYMQHLKATAKSLNKYFIWKAMPLIAGDLLHKPLTGAFHKLSNKTTYEVLSSLTRNQELIAVICGNYGDYGLPPKRSSFAMQAMLSGHYLNGASFPAGGAASIAKSVVPIIEKNGGKVFYNASVEKILVKNKKVMGVRLANGDEIQAKAVVSNAGVSNTFNRLLPQELPITKKLRQKLTRVERSFCAVGLNIGLKQDDETLDLKGANIWSHPSNDFDENTLKHKEDFNAPFPVQFITFPSAKDKTWRENFPGKATIEMFAATDFDHFTQWSGSLWRKRGDDYKAFKEGIAQRMLVELLKHVPQIADHIDHYEVSTPLTYQHFLRREHGDFMGLEASPTRFSQKWLRAETPVKGLFLTGQDVTSDGIAGAMSAGVIAASRILRKISLLKSLISRRKSDVHLSINRPN
ncbi:phytoene desaturase family protein [Veronia nyctiphanis]|nr:NAD(P)/FAD-dependent oxidoreductase [Veronia nyctiphanis]